MGNTMRKCFLGYLLAISLLCAGVKSDSLSNDNTTIAIWHMNEVVDGQPPYIADDDSGTHYFNSRAADLILGGPLSQWTSNPTVAAQKVPTLVAQGRPNGGGYSLQYDGVDDWSSVLSVWNGEDFAYGSVEAEFWFKPLSLPTGTNVVYLIGATIWEVRLRGDGQLQFMTRDADNTARFRLSDLGVVEINKWYHIVVKFEDGVKSLSIRSEDEQQPQVWTASGFTPMRELNAGIYIGGSPSGSFNVNMLISDVKISVPDMPGVDGQWQQARLDDIDTIALLHFDEITTPTANDELFTPGDNSFNPRRRAFNAKLEGFTEHQLTGSINYQFGNALYFNGVDSGAFLTYRSVADYVSREDFRVEAWVKLDEDVVADDVEYPIVSQKWSYRMLYKKVDGQWLAHAIFGYIDGGGIARGVTTRAAVSPYQWNHVALQFDRGIMSLYINGQLKDRTFRRGVYSLREGSSYVSVGWQAASAERFKGLIDEVRFVSTVANQAPCEDGFAGYQAGDVNRDCSTDILDLKLLAQSWLASVSVEDWLGDSADLNYDGKVDIVDFSILSDDWLIGQLLYLRGAESLLPAYLNKDVATLIFDVYTTSAIVANISVEEKDTGYIPCQPITATINPHRGLYPYLIDISSWQDGEYKATITVEGFEPMVRGIRKQTIAAPNEPSEPVLVNDEQMIFVDDYYWDSYENLAFEVHKAELVPIEPWNDYPGIKRYRNAMTSFVFNANGSVTVNITGMQTLNDSEPIQYSAVSSDFINWDVTVNSGELMDIQDISVQSTDTYRFYDEQLDGNVILSQVDVVYTGLQGAVWGDIEMPSRSNFAVWRKNTGENVILQTEPITQDKLVWEDDEIGDWRDTNDNFGRARLYNNNTVLRFYQARRVPRHEPYRIHYDNIWANRIMITWSTTDGINWTPTYFNVPTEEDPVGYQHYGVDIFNAGLNLEMGYLRMYDQKLQKVFTEVVYSRNGLLWNRFGNGLFLDNSDNQQDWNYGYSMTTGNRTRREKDGYYYEAMQGINVLHFMFLQVNNVPDRDVITVSRFHNWGGGRLTGDTGIESSPIWDWYDRSWDNIVEHTKEQTFIPGFMKYRRDGWVSVSPQNSSEEGSFITKVLSSTRSMAINAKTEPQGFVKVEVLNSNGEPLAAYSGANAAVFTGDSVRSNIFWSGGSLTRPPTYPYRLKVTVSDAQLFGLYW